jgi:hypothetical protein
MPSLAVPTGYRCGGSSEQGAKIPALPGLPGTAGVRSKGQLYTCAPLQPFVERVGTTPSGSTQLGQSDLSRHQYCARKSHTTYNDGLGWL